MTYTATWDETTPAGSESRSLGDDRIRELKVQLRERLEEFLIEDMDADPVTSKNGSVFASGTKTDFFQATAPTGWTQDTTYNDKALRVVNSSGGGAGGTLSLSSATVSDHTLTTAEIPSHTHAVSVSTNDAHDDQSVLHYSSTTSGTGYTGSNVGGGGAHNHGLALAYIDVIICTKD